MVKINLFFLLIAGFSFSQQNTARIKEIDAMVIEIEELNNLEERSYYIEITRDTTIIEDDGGNVLRHRASKCQYSSTDFSTLQLDIFFLDDPFGGGTYNFYFKDNKLFFVSFGGGEGGYSFFTYIYYNSLEKPIIFLDEESYIEDDEEIQNSIIITEEDKQKEILSEVQGVLNQILRILNQ